MLHDEFISKAFLR